MPIDRCHPPSPTRIPARTVRGSVVDEKLTHARRTLMAAYAANGLLLSTWFARLPAMAERLGISSSELGLISIALTISSLIATPIAARRLSAWRATRIIRITSPLTAAAMLFAVMSTRSWELAAGLFAVGLANGVQGVGLNAHGTTLSRLAGRSWMPAMLGAASAAGVLGAAVATIATAAHIGLLPHVGTVAIVCVAIGLAVSKQIPIGGGVGSMRIVRAGVRHTAHRLQPGRRDVPRRQLGRTRPHPLTAHTSRRTTIARRGPAGQGTPTPIDLVTWLLIGAGLGATVAEGALVNFGIVIFRDLIGAPVSLAALAFTAFSIAMAIIRLSGGWITATLGPWLTMSAGGAVATVCALVLTMQPALWLAFVVLVGVALGIGCAVPVTFQMATSHARSKAEAIGADVDRAAASALSRLGLATAGGFLSGGPIVGATASLVGLHSAVLIVAIGGAALAACAATLSKLLAGGLAPAGRPVPLPAGQARNAVTAADEMAVSLDGRPSHRV